MSKKVLQSTHIYISLGKFSIHTQPSVRSHGFLCSLAANSLGIHLVMLHLFIGVQCGPLGVNNYGIFFDLVAHVLV
jgi:hypothetical protein